MLVVFPLQEKRLGLLRSMAVHPTHHQVAHPIHQQGVLHTRQQGVFHTHHKGVLRTHQQGVLRTHHQGVLRTRHQGVLHTLHQRERTQLLHPTTLRHSREGVQGTNSIWLFKHVTLNTLYSILAIDLKIKVIFMCNPLFIQEI